MITGPVQPRLLTWSPGAVFMDQKGSRYQEDMLKMESGIPRPFEMVTCIVQKVVRDRG